MNSYFSAPEEIAQKIMESGVRKTKLTVSQMLVLGMLAGACIALAGAGSTTAALNLLASTATVGVGRALSGAVFAAGLMMVVLCGAELFTGNSLMLIGVLDRRVALTAMLKNWVFVYIGNFVGALFVAVLYANSGLASTANGLLGAALIKSAVSKVGLGFAQAVILGVLCNFLVCLAIWMSTGAGDGAGKILSIFFPIMLFVTSGYEHSVANMFTVPVGLLLRSVPALSEAAMTMGVTAAQLEGLTWGAYLGHNLLPVTLGNLIGGGLFVGVTFWFCLVKKSGGEHGEEAMKSAPAAAGRHKEE